MKSDGKARRPWVHAFARGFALAFGSVLLLLPEAPTHAAEAPGPDTWTAEAIIHGDEGVNVTQYWSQGRKLRAETLVGGHRVLTIVNGSTYYALDPVAGVGVAIERSPKALAEDKPNTRPFARELNQVIRDGAEQIGTEKLFGQDCDVYRLTDERGRQEVWATRGALRVPLRVETYARRRAKTVRTDYVAWDRGLTIAPSFFEPDPRLSLETVTYDAYRERTAKGEAVGPVPVMYADLLHGIRR